MPAMKAAKIPSLNDDCRLSLTLTLFFLISGRKKDEVFSAKLPAGMRARGCLQLLTNGFTMRCRESGLNVASNDSGTRYSSERDQRRPRTKNPEVQKYPASV